MNDEKNVKNNQEISAQTECGQWASYIRNVDTEDYIHEHYSLIQDTNI